MTLRKMTNMTVAITEATVQSSALIKVRMATGSVHHREIMEMGMRNMRTNERQAEVRKKPNMTRETILMRSRISLMSEGRLTVEQVRWMETSGEMGRHLTRGTRYQLTAENRHRIEPI